MAHNEDAEYELVLGNKELLSVLFIVVVLLGVFFAMGYVVGRNSGPVDTGRRSEPYVRTDAPSAMPENNRRPQTSASSSDQGSQSTAPATSTAASGTQPPSTTAAQTGVPTPDRSKPIDTTPVSTTQPRPGETFLQVSAVAKPEAEILTELLVKKGFRAIIAAGPSDKIYRVLVGPAKDAADLGKLRDGLDEAGFKSIIRKY
jgi:cell division protein FtsN